MAWSWNSVATSVAPADFIALWNQRGKLLQAALDEKQRETFVDLRDFGNVGGGHDDTTAVNSAFRSLVAGTRLYIPAGKTVNITAQQTILVSDVTVEFGPGASINAVMASPLDNVFYASSKSRLTFLDAKLTGTFRFGYFLTGGSGTRIRRGSVSGGTSSSGTALCGGLYHENIDDFEIEGTDFSGNGDSSGQGTADIRGNLGDGQQVTNCRYLRVKCRSTAVCHNMILNDPFACLIVGGEYTGAYTPSAGGGSFPVGGYGICLYTTGLVSETATGECTVVAPRIHHTQGTGIYLQHVRDSIIESPIVHDVCSVQTDASLGVAGVAMEGSPGSTVNNPRIWNSGKEGITVTWDSNPGVDGNKVIVSNPMINGVTGNGIGIRGAVTDVEIRGGNISNFGKAGVGSYSDAASNRVKILGTQIRTGTNAAVSKGVYQSPLSVDWTVETVDVSDSATMLLTFDLQGTYRAALNTIDGAWRETLTGSATWNPPNVANGAQTSTTVTVTGAALGDPVQMTFSLDLQLLQLTGYVSSANTVTAVLKNDTGGALDLASGTLTATIRRT